MSPAPAANKTANCEGDNFLWKDFGLIFGLLGICYQNDVHVMHVMHVMRFKSLQLELLRGCAAIFNTLYQFLEHSKIDDVHDVHKAKSRTQPCESRTSSAQKR